MMAYFDESGKFADSKIVAYGGVVARKDVLDVLGHLWQARTQKSDIRHFSMKDAMNFEGSFKGWRDRIADRNELLLDLCALIRDVDRVSTAMTVAQFKAQTPDIRRRFGDLNYCGFESCMAKILSRHPSDNFMLTCDLSEEYAENTVKLFNKLRSLNATVKKRCLALTMADDEHFPALQAADMIAYCTRAAALSSERTPDPIVADLIKRLQSPRRESGTFTYGADKGIGEGRLS
jgi:hypothetical protein